MEWTYKQWQRSVTEFPAYMGSLVAGIGRSERRSGATLYVQGLLMPGERKSIEPMAERLGTDSQKLQQFITDSPWDEREVWRTIRREVVPVLEPLAAWIVDETGWLKQGRKSVGVSHQYCGAVGKQANCQVSVGVAVSDGRIAAPVAGRLYLPKSWTDDPERCAAAGVPAGTKFRIKPDIALDLLREVRDDGVTPAPVLGDEAYGTSAAFRRGVRQLGLEYFLNAGNDLSAWTKPVSIRQGKKLWTVASHQAPASSLEAISRSIPQKQWQSVSWRAADTGRCQTRIAYLPVYVHGDLDEHTGEWPETWLVVDWPAGRETPYHLFLAWLKTAPTAKRCLRLSRGRFAIEQFFQRDKTDLGLDHYEGRSWRGFHHHLVLAAIAYIFVLLIYLREKKNFQCDVGAGLACDPAVADTAHRLLSFLQIEIQPEI